MRSLLVLALIAGICGASSAQAVEKIHEGQHWVWYAQPDQYQAHKADIEALYDYADSAYSYLTEAMGVAPRAARFNLLVYPKTGGGFAAGDIGEISAVKPGPNPGIGISYDAFYNVVGGIKGYWGYALITHEMVNLFTGQTVSGGWPVDWWADHVSPFPMMTAVQIEYALRPDVAVLHGRQLGGPLEKMFVALKDQFGWAMFRKAFRAAIEDGIDWSRLGPNPGPVLTNYVCAYLQLGAPEGLHPYFRGVVPGYDANMVADILAARAKWRAMPEDSPDRAKLKDAYLHGKYEAVR
jgi:hypothetical protein